MEIVTDCTCAHPERVSTQLSEVTTQLQTCERRTRVQGNQYPEQGWVRGMRYIRIHRCHSPMMSVACEIQSTGPKYVITMFVRPTCGGPV